MGKVVIKIKIIPEDIDINLKEIEEKAKEEIVKFGGTFSKSEEVPIAFGLKALQVTFLYPDQEFKEEDLLNKIKSIKGVSDAEVVSVSLSSL